VLVLVTALLLVYGSSDWSWIGGPVAALFVFGLEHKSREPGEPSPKHAARRDPAPVD
jgi:hypothetical protein